MRQQKFSSLSYACNASEGTSGVNGLYLNHKTLLVSSPVDPELMSFDITSGFKQGTSYDAPGGSGNGKAIEVINNNILLGRTLGGNELISLVDKGRMSVQLPKREG